MADNFSGFPAVVNDDGSLTTGTPFSAEYSQAVRDSIADNVYSATNPTVKTKTIIDDVVDGRGGFASLDQRMDTLASLASLTPLATQIQLYGGLGATPLVGNDDFRIWAAGDAVAPTLWTLAGAGATIARAGTALGDTTRKIGDFCAKITRVGTNLTLSQTLLNAAGFTRAGFLPGNYLNAGCWVWSNTASAAFIEINDGVATTSSSFHTGNSTWQFLTVSHPINGAATTLIVRCNISTTNSTAYFSGYTAMVLPYASTLQFYVPTEVRFDTRHAYFAGNQAVATGVMTFKMERPGIVIGTELYAKTAPTVTALIYDINHWDGAVWQSMYSTKPQIAAGALGGGGNAMDGTYLTRCFTEATGASVTHALINVDVDAIGTVPGADVALDLRLLFYDRPFERFLVS